MLPVPPTTTVDPLPEHLHYNSTKKDLIKNEAKLLWERCTILPKWEVEAKGAAAAAYKNKLKYVPVSKHAYVPWQVVAAMHMRESDFNFDGCLHNGDPWNKKTTHYPAGLGPWNSWADAASDALRLQAEGWNFDIKNWKWDIGDIFYYLECFNGLGYRLEQGALMSPPYASPYIYSGTPFYVKGKKKERLGPDGKYHGYTDVEQVDQQLGCMAFLYELVKLDPSIHEIAT